MNDALNAALYTFLAAAAPVTTIATGGIWDTVADDEAQFPYVVFTIASGAPDFTFGNTQSTKRHIAYISGYARDTDAKTGRELAAGLHDAIEQAITNAALSISGRDLLSRRPAGDIPPRTERLSDAQSGKHTYSEGVMVEIITAPAS